MNQTALLFPGQASQYVGMGSDLCEKFPIAREMYDLANQILECDLARLSFDGPPEELVQTKFTQPAIFVHSCIAFALAKERGLGFDVAAGHSLGEYSALVACGVLSFEDGLRAVKNRAAFMQAACEANPGTMAAILGLDFDTVSRICSEASGVAVAANYNSEKQIVISGDSEGVEAASQLAKDAGARRVVPLAVGGAFHSPLMRPSPEQLTPVLDALNFQDASTPVIINVTAEPTTSATEIKTRLIEQLTAPVMWYPTMTRMQEMGVTRAIEVGPKKVLCGLAKTVLKGATLLSVDTVDDVNTLMADAEIGSGS